MITEKLKILVVEDILSNFKLIAYQIGKIVENPHVVRVSGLEEFKNSLHTVLPDIILSDYRL